MITLRVTGEHDTTEHQFTRMQEAWAAVIKHMQARAQIATEEMKLGYVMTIEESITYFVKTRPKAMEYLCDGFVYEIEAS